MSSFLWVLQSLLALHTVMGAAWKFKNPAQNIPSLTAIPSGVWISLSFLEFLCALGLLLPALYKPAGVVAPVAACLIALEMLAYSALHLRSSETSNSPLTYWLVVAGLCTFIAYGRFAVHPL